MYQILIFAFANLMLKINTGDFPAILFLLFTENIYWGSNFSDNLGLENYVHLNLTIFTKSTMCVYLDLLICTHNFYRPP